MDPTPPILMVADHDSIDAFGSDGQELQAHWCGEAFPGFQKMRPEAIGAEFEASRFGLILISFSAGCQNGFQVLERIVRATTGLEVPVVLLEGEDASCIGHSPQVIVLPDSTPKEVLAPYLAGILKRNGRLNTLIDEHELTRRLVGNIHREIGQIDEELQTASIVQREFMPKTMPSIGTVSASVLWRPSSYVSGDFYQAVALDERRMGLLLADAAGHGVGSALMTIVMARAFTPLDERGVVDPGSVLEGINQALVQIQGGRMQFATAIYLVVDCVEGTFTYACAGHPAPLLLNEQRMEPLTMTDSGPALGIFEDARYEVMSARLGEEQSLLLYSDGFEHAFPMPNSDVTDLQTPSNAYLNVFKSLSDLKTTQQMINRLEQAIDGRRGSLQPYDDLTLLCARRAPIDVNVAQSA